MALPEYLWHIHIDRNRFGPVLVDAFPLRDKYLFQVVIQKEGQNNEPTDVESIRILVKVIIGRTAGNTT